VNQTLRYDQKEAWITFVVSHAVVTRQVDKMLADRNLPGLDVYEVLLTLEHANEGRLRMSELADHLMLSRSGITRLVDRLERDGFLKRHDCPNDRRATNAMITPEGTSMREQMWPVYREGIVELFGNKMSDDEARVLSKVFIRILGNFPRELLHGMPERCKNAV